MPCKFPGCVAQAEGDACPAHRASGGVPCDLCKGTGRRYYSGQGLTMACQDCGGVGLRDKHQGAPRARKGSDPVDERDLMRLMRG